MNPEPNRIKLPQFNIGDMVVVYYSNYAEEFYGLITEVNKVSVGVKWIDFKDWPPYKNYLRYQNYFLVENYNLTVDEVPFGSYYWKRV
jgi:hypothetical protein